MRRSGVKEKSKNKILMLRNSKRDGVVITSWEWRARGREGNAHLILIDGPIIFAIERKKDVVQEVRHDDFAVGPLHEIAADKAAHKVEVIVFGGPVVFHWGPSVAQLLHGHVAHWHHA